MAEMPSASAGARYPGSEHDARWRRLVMPSGYEQPEPRERYHLVVIGAGPAGLVTAIAAAGLGAHVALIERHALGGDCLNVGCVPSKTLLEFTRTEIGGSPDAEHFDAAFERMRDVRATIAVHDSVERYTQAGVHVFLGQAKFVDQSVVQVGSMRLVTRRTVIATGSHPVLPPIRGLAESRPLTNETVFDLKRRPKRLGILGAGPIGCELAQAFARLGVEVVLLESEPRVLVREDARASALVEQALRKAGVVVELGAAVEAVERRGAHVSIELARGDGERPVDEITVDELLVATGRRPNTDELNLAAVGVELDGHGRIIVDRYLRTTNSKIYAAGDVCSAVQLTHNADAHARIVVQNALFAPTATTDGLVIPRCTYTDPEVAQIGPTAAELEQAGTPFDAYRVDLAELDRGLIERDRGFAEILTAAGGDKILGATITTRDAGNLIAPLAIAMTLDIGLGDLGNAVLPYPTRAEFLRKAADRYRRTKLTPARKRVLDTWLGWRA
jgi:pyruvate/2-oxoglutarate dehydrogenase complex dihydrolipoamide dehydrogenase (E3) component